MTRRALLSLGILLLLAPPSIFAQCNLSASVSETEPGLFSFRVQASGAVGGVRIYGYQGAKVADCPTSPCVYEFSQIVVCTPSEFHWGAACYDSNYAPLSQSVDLHVEPAAHQPAITVESASVGALIDGSDALYPRFQIHAPTAWPDRVIKYHWLPDMIDAGYDRISDVVPADFTRPAQRTVPPGQKLLEATIWSCSDKQATAVVAAQDNACCCQSTPTAPPCVANPISVATGNMRMTDSDPLPGAVVSLARTYDSKSRSVSGRFGMGWKSFLDPVLKSATAAEGTYVTVDTGDALYVFQSSGGTFSQQWPRNGASATLLYDGAAGTFTLHEPLRDVEVVARASDGVPLKYHSRSSGRDVVISYSGAVPTAVADSHGNWSWTLSTDAAGRITAIAVDGTINTWQYTYDTSGQLTEVRGPNNSAWRTYAYGAFGQTEVRDAAGRLIESHTYSYGWATRSLADQGDVTSVTYGLAGDPLEIGTRVTYATGASMMYYARWIAGRPRTTRIVGSCSGCGTNDATYAYDANGNIVREQDARGYISTRVFDSLGRVTSSTIGYKPAGCDPETDGGHCRLSSATLSTTGLDPLPSTVTTTYSFGDTVWPDRPTQVITSSVANPQQSRIASYTYDATTGTVLREQIDGWKNATEQDSIASTTTLYDGIAFAAFNPGGSFDPAWLSLPQPAGLKQALDGPRTDVADVTQWVYYPIDNAVPPQLRGHLAAVRDAAGNVTRFETYDTFGNATRVVDANGVATESAYDAAGRMLTTTLKGVPGCDTTADPLCATDIVTQRSYAPALGPLASETRPNGGTTTYEYDDRRRMTAMTRAVSASAYERAEYDYDAATGKRSAERYKSGAPGAWMLARSEAFAYDVYARLREIDHPDGTKVVYTYDPAGNIATVQDERHTTANTTYAYDPLNRLASVRQTLSSAPGGSIVTSYAYDVAGNLTSVTDPNGNTTTYAFDDFGRMRLQTSPVTGTTSYLYDFAGQLTSSTDANGATTTHTYDEVGRATSATSYRAGLATETVAFTYDNDPCGIGNGRGRLSIMDDPVGEAVYCYDRRGLIISNVDSNAYTMNFAYDSDGNRTSITYPSGRSVIYLFDLVNRPTSSTYDGTSVIGLARYLPFGPLTQLTFGNGTTQTMSYDNRFRPAENRLMGPSGIIADYTYVHDAGGNITALQDVSAPTYDRTFAYDDLNRLTVANSGASLWGVGNYQYDAIGNLTSLQLGNRSMTFSYAGTTPKVQAIGGSYSQYVTYDDAGNEVSLGAYSARNLLAHAGTGVSLIGRSEVQFGYDGHALRLMATMLGSSRFGRNDTWQNSIYSPELHLLAKTDWVSGMRILGSFVGGSDYIWFADRPVAQAFTDSTRPTRYTFADHLGTPILQTDSSATVVWRAEYEPFGSIWSYRVGNAADLQMLRLPGQEFSEITSDDGTELSYNIFRWYRSGWGRYTQPDPLPTLDVFGYADENPVRYLDPLGLRTTYPPPSQMPAPRTVPPPTCVPTVEPTPAGIPAGAMMGYLTVALAVLSGTPAGGTGDTIGDPLRKCNACDDEKRKHDEDCDKILADDMRRCEQWWLQRRVPDWRNYSACKGAAMTRYSECLVKGSPRSPLSPHPYQY